MCPLWVTWFGYSSFSIWNIYLTGAFLISSWAGTSTFNLNFQVLLQNIHLEDRNIAMGSPQPVAFQIAFAFIVKILLYSRYIVWIIQRSGSQKMVARPRKWSRDRPGKRLRWWCRGPTQHEDQSRLLWKSRRQCPWKAWCHSPLKDLRRVLKQLGARRVTTMPYNKTQPLAQSKPRQEFLGEPSKWTSITTTFWYHKT